MSDNFDIQAGGIIEGKASIAEIGQELLEKIAAVADGQMTQAELLGHKEYHIPYKPGRACDVR